MSGLNRGYGRRPDGGDLDSDGDIDLIVPFDSSGSWLNFFFNQTEPVSIQEGDSDSPDDFSLEQNYPNPFNPATNIVFTLPVKSRVKLTIYNLQGQEIITLLDSQGLVGRHILQWHGTDRQGQYVGNGLYFYKLEVRSDGTNSGFTASRKMLLLR